MYIKGEKSKTLFIDSLNKKNYGALTHNMQLFIKKMFPAIKPKDLIKCRYVNNGKVDIEVEVKKEVKRIMIKSGVTNFLHLETIGSFLRFLNSIGVEKRISTNVIKIFFGNESLTNDEMIAEINAVFLEPQYRELLLQRILCYDYYHKPIDFLYYGNLISGYCLSIQELKTALMNYQNNHNHQGIRINNLRFQGLDSVSERRATPNKAHVRCGFKVWNLFSYVMRQNKSNP